MKKLIRHLIPEGMGRPLLTVLVWNLAVYFGSRLISGGAVHHDMSLPADRAIPLLPWTVAVYLGAFIFWAVNYILACRFDSQRAWRFVTAEVMAKTVCLALFIFYPTTLARQEPVGGGFWVDVMRLIYAVDAPDNLFPSIHCLASWFCFIAVRGNKEIPLWYRAFSLVFALAVCASTLTTAQHVILDAVAGVALAELSWQLVGLTRIHTFTQKVFSRREK